MSYRSSFKMLWLALFSIPNTTFVQTLSTAHINYWSFLLSPSPFSTPIHTGHAVERFKFSKTPTNTASLHISFKKAARIPDPKQKMNQTCGSEDKAICALVLLPASPRTPQLPRAGGMDAPLFCSLGGPFWRVHRAPQRAPRVGAQESPAATRSVAHSCTAFPPPASLAPIPTPVRGTTYQIKLSK